MATALFHSLCRAGGEKRALWDVTVQRHMFEGQRGHRRDGAPVGDACGCRAAPLTHAPIGRDAVELVREDFERQRFEVSNRSVADEGQGFVVNGMNGNDLDVRR